MSQKIRIIQDINLKRTKEINKAANLKIKYLLFISAVFFLTDFYVQENCSFWHNLTKI